MTAVRSGQADREADSPLEHSPHWQILGPLRGWVDGDRIEIGPRRRRMLLASLLAAGGERTSMDALVPAVWGEDSPRGAVNIVHKHVGALRRLTAPDLPRRAQGGWLSTSAGALELHFANTSLDLLHFRALVLAADRSADERTAFERLAEAVNLWRGPAAADIRGAFHDETPFAALDQEFVNVATCAGQLAKQLGQSHRITTALELAVRISPTDERVRAQLIRCLATAGRRDAALNAFHSMRRLLREDLGIEPGPAVVAAQQAALGECEPDDGVVLRTFDSGYRPTGSARSSLTHQASPAPAMNSNRPDGEHQPARRHNPRCPGPRSSGGR